MSSYDNVYHELVNINKAFFPDDVQTHLTGLDANSNVSLARKLISDDGLWTMYPEASNMKADWRSNAALSTVFYRKQGSNTWNPVSNATILNTTTSVKGTTSINVAELNLMGFIQENTPLWNLCVQIDNLMNYDFTVFNAQRVPDYTRAILKANNTVVFPKKTFTLEKKIGQTTNPYETFLNNIHLLENPDASDVRATTNFMVFRRLLLLYKLSIQYQIIRKLYETKVGTTTTASTSTVMLAILQNINEKFVEDNSDIVNLRRFIDDTNKVAHQYNNQMNDLKSLNTDFKKTRTMLETSSELKNSKVRMEAISGRVKIVMMVLSVIAIGILAFSITMAGDRGAMFGISLQVFGATLLLAVVLYGFSRNYSIELFSTANPSNDQQLNQFYNTYTNMSLGNAVRENWIAEIIDYLKMTSMAGIALQTNNVYSTVSDMQNKDIYQLSLYNENLKMKAGDLEIASKLTEQNQRNNIVYAWLVIGLVLIASITAAMYSVLGAVQLLGAIVLVAGGLAAVLYSLVLILYIHSRTRRDPSKFYFQAPNFDTYNAQVV